jgi:hypothetical protein
MAVTEYPAQPYAYPDKRLPRVRLGFHRSAPRDKSLLESCCCPAV